MLLCYVLYIYQRVMFTAAIFPAVRAAGQQTPHEIPRKAAQAGATAQDVSPQDGFFERVFNVRLAFPDGISHGFPHLWWIFPWFESSKLLYPNLKLVGGFKHGFYCGNVIIPTDEIIFFRGVGIPPTSKFVNHQV